MADIAIVLDRVSFSFGRRQVLKELSIDVPAGLSFGLLGPNGAGKTTLIRLMVGLLRPSSGCLRIMGVPLSRRRASLIGYMPQLQSLYNELTVRQNVDFFAHIYGLRRRAERAERVGAILKLVGLWDRRNDAVQQLSGGMKQRASLACAIVHNPPLLFLDEPTVGLDPELRANFWDFFKSLTKSGATIVISSHTMDDAAHCDRLGLMRDGKIIAQGTPDGLRQATDKTGATLEDAFLYFVRQGKEGAR